MSNENFGPMTEEEAQKLVSKLGALVASLTAKERWFLEEALARGVETGSVDVDVEGYVGGASGNVFFPTGMGSSFGVSKGQTSAGNMVCYTDGTSFSQALNNREP